MVFGLKFPNFLRPKKRYAGARYTGTYDDPPKRDPPFSKSEPWKGEARRPDTRPRPPHIIYSEPTPDEWERIREQIRQNAKQAAREHGHPNENWSYKVPPRQGTPPRQSAPPSDEEPPDFNEYFRRHGRSEPAETRYYTQTEYHEVVSDEFGMDYGLPPSTKTFRSAPGEEDKVVRIGNHVYRKLVDSDDGAYGWYAVDDQNGRVIKKVSTKRRSEKYDHKIERQERRRRAEAAEAREAAAKTIRWRKVNTQEQWKPKPGVVYGQPASWAEAQSPQRSGTVYGKSASWAEAKAQSKPVASESTFERFGKNYKPSFVSSRAPSIKLPQNQRRFIVASDYRKFDQPLRFLQTRRAEVKALLPPRRLVHVTSIENLGGILKTGAIFPSPKKDLFSKTTIGNMVSLSSIAGPYLRADKSREVAIVIDVTKLGKQPFQLNYDTLKKGQMPWTAPAFSFEREWITTEKIPIRAIRGAMPLAGAKNEYLRYEVPARFRYNRRPDDPRRLPAQESIYQKVPYNWVPISTLLRQPNTTAIRQVLGVAGQSAADKKYDTMARSSAIPLAGDLPGSLETSLDYVQRYRKPGDKVLVQRRLTAEAMPGEHFALLHKNTPSKQNPTGEPIISEYWPGRASRRKAPPGLRFVNDISGEEYSNADVYTQEINKNRGLFEEKESGPLGYENYLGEMTEPEFQEAAASQKRFPLANSNINPDEQVVVAEEPELSDAEADELADELLLNEYLAAQKRQEALEEAEEEKDDDKDDDDDEGEDEEKKEIAPKQ